MLYLHETHKVVGKREDDFEAALQDWMLRLAKEGDQARLLYFAHHAHGSGPSYQVVTLTAVRDGAAWEELARRIQSGDLQRFMRELDELRHDVEGKLLLPVYWSPLQEVDVRQVPSDGREHEPSLFMEDTGWPSAPLDEYIRFWNDDYFSFMKKLGDKSLLDIQACFQVAHGTHLRREAMLWQKILSDEALIGLLKHDTPPEMRRPGTYMYDSLEYRDQWRSRLLRTARWSPLY